MCKYVENVELEPEVRRLLIKEFGSIQEAKKDMNIFSKHLPEKLQTQLNEFVASKYPQLKSTPGALKECTAELNKRVQLILTALY